MGSKGNAFITQLLAAVFQGKPLEFGDALYVSLHTDDPGPGGTQADYEVTYPGYKRIAVSRSETGWVVVGQSVSPADTVAFPAGAEGTNEQLCTHAVIGAAESGPGMILHRGALRPRIKTGEGVMPEIPPTSTITES